MIVFFLFCFVLFWESCYLQVLHVLNLSDMSPEFWMITMFVTAGVKHFIHVWVLYDLCTKFNMHGYISVLIITIIPRVKEIFTHNHHGYYILYKQITFREGIHSLKFCCIISWPYISVTIVIPTWNVHVSVMLLLVEFKSLGCPPFS